MEIDEREALKKKRENWLAERIHEKKLNSMGINKDQIESSSSSQILTEITMKITEKYEKALSMNSAKNPSQIDMKFEKTISKEIESNTCGICYELMVPPLNSPMLLFPCGHTFCKACIYLPNNQQHINKCPFCRTNIKSVALNISLQKLICIFSNNKHLLEKYENEESIQEKQKEKDNSPLDNNSYKNNLDLCNIRYNILVDEMKEIEKINNKLDIDYGTQEAILEKLKGEKNIVVEKIEKMKKELALIEKYVNQSEEELNEMVEKKKEFTKKKNLIRETLDFVKTEKEKYEILINN